jgi:hypothetical protein
VRVCLLDALCCPEVGRHQLFQTPQPAWLEAPARPVPYHHKYKHICPEE